MPITGWGIIMGRSMQLSTILFPTKEWRARIYARGVPSTSEMIAARPEQYTLSHMARITFLSCAVSHKLATLGWEIISSSGITIKAPMTRLLEKANALNGVTERIMTGRRRRCVSLWSLLHLHERLQFSRELVLHFL
jgi:hypothetical protein